MLNGNPSHWLTAARATAYAHLVLAAFMVIWLGLLALPDNVIDRRDLSLELDFMAFWGASHLALTGHALDAHGMHQRP